MSIDPLVELKSAKLVGQHASTILLFYTLGMQVKVIIVLIIHLKKETLKVGIDND